MVKLHSRTKLTNMDALDVLAFPPISQEAIDIVIGTLMGDASLAFSSVGAASIYDLGLLHKDIVVLVAAVISQYANGTTRTWEHFDKRSGKYTTSIRFATTRSPVFLPFAQMFYTVTNTGGILKHLPNNFGDLLTPRALAFWIMDDGQAVKRGGVTLCTDNFTL